MGTDKLEREAIFNKLDHNLLVKASAGSGKTTLLVEKLVALVEKCEADPSRIAALTFTKKAAAEFYDRFYKKLQLRSKPDFDYRKDDKYSLLGNHLNEKEIELDKNALKKIDTCFLGTIDAFYQNILNEHPLEAGLASSTTLIEEEQLDSILTKKFSEYLVNPKYKDLALFFSDNVGAKNFPSIAKMVLNNRLLNIVQIQDNINDLLKKYSSTLQAYKDGLHVLLKDEETIAITSEKKSREAWEYLRYAIGKFDSLSENDYLDAKKLFGKLKGKIRYYVDKNSPFYHTHNIYSLYSKIYPTNGGKYSYTTLTDDPYFDITALANRIVFYYTIEFMNLIKDDLVKTLNDDGILTFSEATIYLLNMLRKEENKKIIDQIRSRYDYILIDECQDTDINQYEIFFRLAGNNYPSNWKDMNIKGGKLFIVGDRKQSIYHFRGADVSTFDEIKDIFEQNKTNGKPFDVITLTDNYRSKGGLIQYFNKTFSTILDSQGYEKIPNDTIDTSKGEEKYTAYNYITTKDSKYDEVIKIIESKLNEGYQYKDFMIITSSKNSTTQYASELIKRNIPCYTEGNIDFKITSYLEAVLNLFIYIASKKENKIAYLEFLSSPIFNFDISKSIDLNYDYISLLGLNFDSLDIWPSNVLESIASNDMIAKSIDILGFEILASLIHLLKLEETNKNINNYYDAVTYIKKILEPNTIERLSLLSGDVNAIEIANAHKTKGLQKPIVILAPVSKSNNKTPSTAKGNGEFHIFSFKPENSYDEILSNPDKKTPFLENIYNEEIQYENGEDRRLLYVAATRAEDYLYIPTVARGGRWDELYKDLYLKAPQIIESNLQDPKREKISIKPFVSVVDINRKEVNKNSYRNVSPSMTSIPSKLIEEDSYENEMNLDESAIRGTLIHKLMEYIVNSKNVLLDDNVCSYIVKRYNREDLLDLLIKVKKTIYSGGFKQSEPQLNDLLAFIKPYKCLTEVPFSYKDNDKIVYGFIDLLIETENEIIVIDYKTGNEAIDHQEQLQYYEKIAALHYNKPIKSYLYFIHCK